MDNVINLLNYKWGKRLPIMLQSERAECGLVCVAMIANYHGKKIGLSSLRRNLSVSLKGTTFNDLIKVADELNLTSRPVKLDLDSLKHLKVPCILHWSLDHFVVLKSVKNNVFIIHDPAVGIREMKVDEVSKYFTGVALELTPTSNFKKNEINEPVKLNDFWSSMTGLKRKLLQIFILSLLLQIFAIASPLYMQIVIDDVVISEDVDLLFVIALGFLGVLLFDITITLLRSSMILYLGTQLNIQMASNLFRHLFKLPMEYFEKRHVGDVISRFGSLENIKQLLTTGVIETIVDGIMAIGLLIMMFIYSPILGLIVLITLALYLLIRILLYRPYRLLTEEYIVASAKQNSNFIETVRGVQSIKLFGKEVHMNTLWLNNYANSINADIKISKLNINYRFINGLMFGIENILVIYIAALSVIDGRITIGMLFAFISYKIQFIRKASALVERFIEFKMISLHLERLADIIHTETEPTVKKSSFKNKINGSLTLENICFRFSDNEPNILTNYNIEIPQGETVVIYGSSGSGKTTLMKIMLGLIKPNKGKILIDGYDIHQIGLSCYREMVATVMQDDLLFSGSIADNICLFEIGANQNKIEECAKMAAIHKDITVMPMSYLTLVGDMGSCLSGGQKQRILLARALYKNPKILFLDEATAHLDPDLERSINETIKNLNITRIIIAHRQETLSLASRTIELKLELE